MLEHADAVVDVGRPQQRQKRVIAAEKVQRQVAVGVVGAVEEAAQRMAMQHEVGPVQVQDDAGGRDQVLLHKRLNEEGLHGVQMGHDLFVAAGGIGSDGGEFEA